MKFIRKIFIGLLIVVFLNVNPCEISFAQVGSEEEELTRHLPEVRFYAEEAIPVGKKDPATKTWAWVILGVLVVGGVVALAAGSGGGGNGGGSTSGGSNVTVGW